MAIEVLSWVLNNSHTRGADRLVLIAIADSASNDGTNAYPSISTIARKSQTPERSVQRSVRKMVERNQLKVELAAGPKGCNRYTVLMHEVGRTPDTTSPRHHVTPDTASPDTTSPGVTPRSRPPDVVSPEPSLNRPTTSPSVDGSVRSAQKTRGPAAGDRGTRISRDFKPDTASIERIRALGFSNAELRYHTEQFIDYWDAESGSKATKKRWNSAWCVWMRKETPGRWPGNPQNRGGSRNGRPAGAAEAALDLAEQLRAEGR